MKIATILYGQQRTFKYTFPSIKRLFKDILKTDFYVIINENNDTHFQNNLCDGGYLNNYDLMSSEELDNLINKLEPKVYKKINVNSDSLKKYYKESPLFTNFINDLNKKKLYSLTWEEYKKNHISEELLSIDECIKNGCEIKNINYKSHFDISNEFNNVEAYLRNLGLFHVNLARENENYTHIFFIRTDLIWFEDFNQKDMIKGNTISNIDTINNILNFNKQIQNYEYKELINIINNNINKNEEDILTWYFYNENLNIYLSIEQAGLFRIENILPKNYYKDINIFDNFLFKKISLVINNYYKYPLLHPGWNGELSQKIRHLIYNNNISKNHQFGKYFILLRNKKI